jgi:tape measure domain-containing protein
VASVDNVVKTTFTADVKGLQTGLQQVQSGLAQVSGAASGINKTNFAMTAFGTAAGIAGAMLVSKVIQPLTALPALGVKLAAQYEQTQIAFTTMLGSADKANQFLDELKDFAARTPFELDGLLSSAKMMQAFGFEAKEVIPTLTAVGDASAALGLGTEGVGRITLALGQMKAMGRVLTQDLKQLQFAGVPAVQMLADSFGKTVPEMQKMIESGEVASEVAIPMLIKAMQVGTENTKGFGGMMEAQSKTFTGVMSTFKDEAQFALIDGVMPALKGATQALKEMTPVIRPLVGVIGNLIGQGFMMLTSAVLAVVRPIISLMEFMDGLRNGTQKLSEPVARLMGTFQGLGNMLNKNLLGVLEAVRAAFDEFIRPAIERFVAMIRRNLPNIQTLVNAFGAVANIITRYVLPAFVKVAGFFFGRLLDAITKVVDGAIKLGVAFTKTILDIANGFVKGYNFFLPAVNAILRATNNADKQLTALAEVTIPSFTAAFGAATNSTNAAAKANELAAARYQAMADAAAAAKKPLEDAGGGLDETGGKAKKAKEEVIKLTAAMRGTLNAIVSFNAGSGDLFRTLGGDDISRFASKLLKAKEITEDLADEFDDLVDVVKGKVTAALDAANDKLREQQALYDGVFNTVRDGVQGSFSLSEAIDASTQSTQAVTEALKAQAEAQGKVNEAVANGDEDAIAEANKDLAEANAQLDEAKKNEKSFLGFLKVGADTAIAFADQIDALRLAGGSLALVQEIAKLGAQRGLIAVNELLRGGAAAIAEANQLIAAVETAANRVAKASAEQFYGAGVRAAQAYVNALRDVLLPQLEALLNEIAAILKRQNVSLGDRGGGGAPAPAGPSLFTELGRGGVTQAGIEMVRQGANVPDFVVANYIISDPRNTTLEEYARQLGVTGFATGGIVARPTLGLIGEAGPEAVIPLSQMGSNNTYKITVNVPVSANAAEVGRQVVDAITAFERRNGRVYEPA